MPSDFILLLKMHNINPVPVSWPETQLNVFHFQSEITWNEHRIPRFQKLCTHKVACVLNLTSEKGKKTQPYVCCVTLKNRLAHFSGFSDWKLQALFSRLTLFGKFSDPLLFKRLSIYMYTFMTLYFQNDYFESFIGFQSWHFCFGRGLFFHSLQGTV